VFGGAKGLTSENLVRELGMQTFEPKLISAMRTVFDEVCSHIPSSSTSARTFVAARILECARSGEETYEGLLAAGRRAVIDQFGSVDAIQAKLR
jgi:hypothetical protein